MVCGGWLDVGAIALILVVLQLPASVPKNKVEVAIVVVVDERRRAVSAGVHVLKRAAGVVLLDLRRKARRACISRYIESVRHFLTLYEVQPFLPYII